jgi:DNA-binding LacI/PurR family transcriptional regulator
MPTSMIGVSVKGVPSVTIDDVQASRTATQHLVNLGHQRIGLIAQACSSVHPSPPGTIDVVASWTS